MPRVTVSIINYRTSDLTIACVESVLADIAGDGARPAIDAEVVVIDNASGDGSAERLAAWIADRPDAPVRLMRSEVNGGFSAGHNQVIAATGGEFVLLLNSDAELRPGCLGALIAGAEAHPEAGLVSARLEDPDGTPQTSCFRFPTPISEFIRGAATGPVTRALSSWDVPLGPEPEARHIQWTAFACLLMRRSMIDRIGMLDEDFFLYFEDVEYCRRALQATWTIHFEPSARSVHHVGGSTNVTSSNAMGRRRPAYYYAARARYFFLVGGRANVVAANIGWSAGRFIARCRGIVGRSRPPSAEAELRDIWTTRVRLTGPRHPAPLTRETF